MVDILIGVIGKIISGEEYGRFVKVIDDSENTGGFLILTADDIELSSRGYDNWVEDKERLKCYFLENKWLIEWSR